MFHHVQCYKPQSLGWVKYELIPHDQVWNSIPLLIFPLLYNEKLFKFVSFSHLLWGWDCRLSGRVNWIWNYACILNIILYAINMNWAGHENVWLHIIKVDCHWPTYQITRTYINDRVIVERISNLETLGIGKLEYFNYSVIRERSNILPFKIIIYYISEQNHIFPLEWNNLSLSFQTVMVGKHITWVSD